MRSTGKKTDSNTQDHLIYAEMPDLPASVQDILHQDFWLYDNLTSSMIGPVTSPMKFSSSVCIYVRKGTCKAQINLQTYEVEAPSLVIISSRQIMQPLAVSDDFEGAFIVMSRRFVRHFIRTIDNKELTRILATHPIIRVPRHLSLDFELVLKNMRRNIDDPDNKYPYHTLFFILVAFFYQTGVKCLLPLSGEQTRANHITTRFMRLAHENFHRERFLAYYAERLQITPKHLSRTVKADTGVSASEWLDRLVVLEAKVLLRSSNLNIQQIADRLNFPSQSFFGKYFKKNVGISPKEFRNS